jgi:hypothetical protein
MAALYNANLAAIIFFRRKEGNIMSTMEMTRKDTIDLDPAEFIKMRAEAPERIAGATIMPPVLGKSNNFGKIRVKLSTPRYEVEL